MEETGDRFSGVEAGADAPVGAGTTGAGGAVIGVGTYSGGETASP